PDLIQETFHRQFREIRLELERMGYINYVETLNAKHYGVAQNRNRVFMVSILGDYSYTFPKRVKLQKQYNPRKGP
ncbi:MAG: DNA cytosine methyltransferase, partial [Pirellulaceae bacterium]